MVKIVKGEHGFLFLGGEDSNDLISQHTGKMDISPVLPIIRYGHLARREFLKVAYSAQYLHIVAPNKETVAREFMPDAIVYEEFGPSPVNQYILAAPEAKDTTFFRPEILHDFHAERFYYLTDTHWTFRGAKRYLEAALGQFDLSDQQSKLQNLRLRVDDLPFVGDLATHIGHSGETQEHILPSQPTATQEFYNGIGTEGRVFHFRNATASGRALVLIDSTGSWMLNFLAELFQEVLVIHTPDLDLRVVDLYRPNVVFAIQCERFFPRPMRDGVDWRPMIVMNEERKAATSTAILYLKIAGYI